MICTATQTTKPIRSKHVIYLDGKPHKICCNSYCKFGGKPQPITNFRVYHCNSKRDNIVVREYSHSCNDCLEYHNNKFLLHSPKIDMSAVPPGVKLIRAIPGAVDLLENSYRPGAASSIFRRRVHYVEFSIGDDIMITYCGKSLATGEYMTNDLEYGKLCSVCEKYYHAR